MTPVTAGPRHGPGDGGGAYFDATTTNDVESSLPASFVPLR